MATLGRDARLADVVRMLRCSLCGSRTEDVVVKVPR